MAVTCEQVAQILSAGGMAALAGHPDAQAHVGECETCADRVIDLETSAPADPTPAGPAAADAPAATPMPGELAATPAASAPTAVPTPAELAPKAAEPAGAPTPAEPAPGAAEPAEAATPAQRPAMPATGAPIAAAAPVPPVPSGPEPQDVASWVPSGLPPMPHTDGGFGGRREYVQIKPLHLGFIAVGSAVVGGLVVLAVSLLVRPVLAPSMPIDPVLEQTDGEVSLDLVPVFEVDEETELETPAEAPRKAKRGNGRRRQRRDKRERTATLAAPLTRADIATGIKANLHRLGPCFRAARKRKELTPGRHPLVVAFRIQPSGSVQDGVLTGPSYLVGKRIAKCVANKLRTWKFPASSNGAPVRGLSLPINVQ